MRESADTCRVPDSLLATYRFVDSAIGGVQHRNTVRDLTRWTPPIGERDVFVTWMRHPEALRTYAAGHVSSMTGKSPSVEGYGDTGNPALVVAMPLDYDHGADLSIALAHVRADVLRWQARYDLDPCTLRLCASGSKGFSVEIPASLVGGIPAAPGRALADRVERFIGLLNDGSPTTTLDTSIYHPMALWRVPGSRRSSGRYKTPLTVGELLTLDVPAIMALTAEPREWVWPDHGEWSPNPALVELWEQSEPLIVTNGHRVMVNGHRAAPLPERLTAGNRHPNYVSTAARMRNLGLNTDEIDAALQMVNAGRADEPKPADEVRKIAEWAGTKASADERREHERAAYAEDDDPQPDAATEGQPLPNLPTIQARNRQLRAVSRDALTALQRANTPPRLFVRGGTLVRVTADEAGRPFIQSLSLAALRGRLARVADWETVDKDGRIKDVPPPDDVVEDVLALGAWPFPPLAAVVTAPVLREDGSILDTAGYDEATALLYHPDPALAVPPIPAAPTAADARRAAATVCALIADFPFDGEASRANALALLLSQILRVLSGLVPIALLDKTSPGTGASLLAEVAAIIATGRSPGMMAAPRTDEEMEKRITTLLRDGQSLVVLDNVDRPLDYSSLSQVLTAEEWAGRILGRSEAARFPHRTVWMATGNNLRVRGDVARRSYWIRMDAKRAEPWRRSGFRIADLKGHTLAHRGELLAALLTMARAWIVAGRPAADVPHLGMFERWTRTVGGVLAYAGVDGFLSNLDELYEHVDTEGPQWAAFLAAWRLAYGGTPVAVRQLCADVASDDTGNAALLAALPDDLADMIGGKGSPQHRIGRALAHREGRRYGPEGLHLVRAGEDSRGGRVLWTIAADEGGR